MSERRYRERCVAAGAVSGTCFGLGIGLAQWANPYIVLTLVLGGWLLLIVAKVAVAERSDHEDERVSRRKESS